MRPCRLLSALAVLLLLPACGEDDLPAGYGSDVGPSDVPVVLDVGDAAADVPGVDADAVSGDVPDGGLADVLPEVVADVAPDVAPDVEPDVPPAPVDLVNAPGAGAVVAGTIADEAALLGGVRAEGRVGDFKLMNAHVAFVVEGPRRAHGYRHYGGNVVDAVSRRADGSWRPDTYGETIFAWDLEVLEPESVKVISNGSDGLAHVRATGRSFAIPIGASLLGGILVFDDVDLEVTQDFYLGADDKALRMEFTLTNVGPKPSIELPAMLANHGDGTYIWTPGGGGFGSASASSLAQLSFVGQEQAYGIISERDDLSFMFNFKDVAIASHAEIKIATGASAKLAYWLAVSATSVNGLQRIERDLLDPPASATMGRVSGTVTLPAGAAGAEAFVGVWFDGGAHSLTPVTADGSYEAWLDAGKAYELVAYVTGHEPTAAAAVTIGADDVTQDFTVTPSAHVQVQVVDQGGSPTPARVTFIRKGDTPSPYAPEEIDPQRGWRGSTSAVVYAVAGDGRATVPAGSYRAVASRGFAWEIDDRTIDLVAGENAPLTFTIEKSVDTAGWTSSDFHIHSVRSPDSYVPYEVRAMQAVTEDLDAPVQTEHVSVATMQTAIEALGLDDRTTGIAGQEVTSFEYGHFTTFPLVEDALAPNRGAISPYSVRPPELFENIRAQQPQDEIIQVAHPRSPASYFLVSRLNSETSEPTRAVEDWSFNWDTVEVFNGGCGYADNEALADWIGLTNNGYRKVLSGGSDTHSESKPMGTPRIWVEVESSAVAADSQALVAPIRGRRAFVSCGPFVRFTTSDDATGMGGLAAVNSSGEVSFKVEVQAPSWMKVHELRVLRNGVEIDTIAIPESLDVVRLDATVTDTPGADAWYAVQVIGSGSNFPMGGSSPFAMTNPIEVDADGDSMWTPPGPNPISGGPLGA